jgi:hypothetical protein
MGLICESFRCDVVVATAKLSHPRFGVFNAISRLSKRIKLQPLVPTRRTDGWFGLAGIVERHAVFEPHIAFVKRVNARAARGKTGQPKRPQGETNRPR